MGMELGSTRIKAVLIGEDFSVLAAGSHEWANELKDGVWTYPLEAVWAGVQDAYKKMAAGVKKEYGVTLTKIRAAGFSAMMHGYLVFGKDGKQLVPFRTWRNTSTGRAAEQLSQAFSFNIPQRWSIAHLYQAALDGEKHVKDVSYMTTLAGYVHWKLTGIKTVGTGEASGMFPLDCRINDYDADMLEKFDALIKARGPFTQFRIKDILPKVSCAGANAGTLTKEGALLLDPSGNLMPGALLCPPEGDAGTGMVATNSVAQKTGNVSAGTSVFAMLVLDKPLKKVYPEIDIVATPDGMPVAMVHCNTCTSDINAWAGLFNEVIKAAGADIPQGKLMILLFTASLSGDADCGGLMNYNYFSGEPVTGLSEGRPLFARKPDAAFTLANFMKTQLYSALATLRIGMEILKPENIGIANICGHGGFFKTKEAGQRAMAAAVNAPVTVMENAGEGGAWGIALLAAYAADSGGESLPGFLNSRVFKNAKASVIKPRKSDTESFDRFMERYKAGLKAERAAAECL